MDRFEWRIRDYIAANLQLVEPGLVLVKKEFSLPSRLGAGGTIDILARDALSHYVIIEIKRSDQTARTALHELTKYSALLKASLGIRPEQIRALLLSTEWHELAVPFSEYQKVCEVPTDGVVISAVPSGVVTGVTRFVPPAIDEPLCISRQQYVFLFGRSDRRDACFPKLIKAADRARVADFAVISVNYTGEDRRIIHRHGAYFVFSSPAGSLDRHAKQEDANDIDAALLDACLRFTGFDRDSSEVGTPEKLVALMSSGWAVSVASRHGRYAANGALLSDDQLIAEATRSEGGAEYYLQRTASPRYSPSWEKLKRDAELVLRGNSAWSNALVHLFATWERESPSATVSISLYNPANIVFSLSKLFGNGDVQYLPGFQIVATHGDNVTFYVGLLVWDGSAMSMRGREWIERVYGSVKDYCRMQHCRQQHTGDELACRLIGLSSAVLEVRCRGTGAEEVAVLMWRDGKQGRTPLAESKAQTVAEFCENNQAFGLALVEDVGAFSVGWVN